MQKETPNALRKHDNFEIIFFELDNDSCPVQDFLDSLNDKMAAKVYGMMDVLAEFGNELREPYTKELEDEIYELRAKTGTDICRVLFFFRSGKKIIITNGFIKKQQKTPRSEINLAKKYRKVYLARRKDAEK
jgi:phage-related protein